LWSFQERLDEFFRRLDAAPAASQADDALALIARLLDDVEDEFSGIPKNANPGLKRGGRMYPPREDFITRHSDGSLTARTRGHIIEVRSDGSFSIQLISSQTIVLSKPSGGRP